MTSVAAGNRAAGLEQGHPTPVLFVGHGNPMNGISRNRYADGWRSVAAALPRPRAVLAVSAHWYTRGTRDHAPLVAYQTLGPAAALSVPTPDHYLPLLYALAGPA